MRVNFPVILITILMMMCSAVSAAQQNQINIQCNEIESIQILQSMPEMQVAGNGGCTSDCYFVFFIQPREESVKTNKKIQSLAGKTAQISVNDKVVLQDFEVSSSYPLPSSKYFSSDRVFSSYAEALQNAQQFCPDKINKNFDSSIPGFREPR